MRSPSPQLSPGVVMAASSGCRRDKRPRHDGRVGDRRPEHAHLDRDGVRRRCVDRRDAPATHERRRVRPSRRSPLASSQSTLAATSSSRLAGGDGCSAGSVIDAPASSYANLRARSDSSLSCAATSATPDALARRVRCVLRMKSCAMPASAVTRMPVATTVSSSVNPRADAVDAMPGMTATALPRAPIDRRSREFRRVWFRRRLARAVASSVPAIVAGDAAEGSRVRVARGRATTAGERQPQTELRAASGTGSPP